MLIGLRKLELARFFHSLRLTTNMDLLVLSEPGVIFGGSSNSLATNPVRNLSVVGPFSVPSVSGPALKACSYHIDLALFNNCQMSKMRSRSNAATRRSAAACVENDFGGVNLKHKQLLLLPYIANNLFRDRSIVSCRHAGYLLRSQRRPHNAVICRYLLFHERNRLCISSAFSGIGSTHSHSLASTCLSVGTVVRDVSFNSISGKEPLETDATSLEGRVSSGKFLKLLSGSCYLPHPDKEETGGEDAHFICVDEQAIGVADGVGGWADLGVDAGQYSRELTSNTVSAIQEEPKGSLNLARVLEKAHLRTKSKGSSTACIIALTDQGLHAINLGDSGFMVVRDGCTILRSPVQQHDFNFTYQLESGNNGDLPSSGQVFAVPVASGDVIIAGTDGLFDNLYSNEITALVVQAMRAGSGPQLTAQKIAALAHERAQSKDRQTPFSRAAQDAGYRYYGGKLDDITVVVSYVISCTQKK